MFKYLYDTLYKKWYKAHDSLAIANLFVEKAAREDKWLTIAQLVKLVYLAHGWSLGFTGNPLIKDHVEAWKLGPVIPRIYREFSHRGHGVTVRARAMNGSGHVITAKLDAEQQDLVDRIYHHYGHISFDALTSHTSVKGTPWHSVQDQGIYARIPDEIIRDYYARLHQAGGRHQDIQSITEVA